MSEHGTVLPKQGLVKADILERMAALRDEDVRWHENRAFSLVFHQSDEHTEFLKQAHGLFFEGNGLNPMAFKSLRTFEHETVRMSVALLNGDSEAVGTMTSGGTESILLAVRTYRDRARKLTPWISAPEIVVPETAHVAFDKAGKYFDVKIVHAALGRDGRVDMRSVRRMISRNTIALVGSAPNYPNGMIDPIEELAALAEKHGLGMHVDACIGGFFLPWAERLGRPIPPFDFRVSGVTSISADLHKYGYAAKGASLVLYRSMDYLRYQFFVCTDWPGGVFASPSFPGTRPGGTIAAAWAALMAMGEEGYLENARIVLDIARRFREGIDAIPGLKVLGDPLIGVMAYSTTERRLNCYAIADRLSEKGWHVDRQQRPATIHLMLNPGHGEIVDAYLADLREAVGYVRANPDAALSGSAPAYGLIANAPIRGLVARNVLAMMEHMYSAEGAMPQLSGNGKGGSDAVPGFVLKLLKFRSKVLRLFGR
jgi:glutamate/tyrosine decarboxylase-like PLP-dependent enzyme